MIFCRRKVCSPGIWRGFTGQVVIAAWVLANAGFLQPTTVAQMKTTAETGPEAGYGVEACPHVSNPNALKELAGECSKSLASAANCRTYTNFKKDSETVESYIILKDCAGSKPFG